MHGIVYFNRGPEQPVRDICCSFSTLGRGAEDQMPGLLSVLDDYAEWVLEGCARLFLRKMRATAQTRVLPIILDYTTISAVPFETHVLEQGREGGPQSNLNGVVGTDRECRLSRY